MEKNMKKTVNESLEVVKSYTLNNKRIKLNIDKNNSIKLVSVLDTG